MKSIKAILVLTVLLLTAACGGGGGSKVNKLPQPTTTVTGVASAGIIKGGTVKIFQPYSSLSGADKKQLGKDGVTGDDGSYSINIGTYTGPVIVEVTGGSYADEADPTTPKSIPTNAPLRAAISNAKDTVSVAVTPLTELAVKQVIDKKLGAANIDKANAQISDLFLKGDIIGTTPLDASKPITTGGQAEQDYTLALAALSKLGATNSKTLDVVLNDISSKISAGGTMEATTASDISAALTAFLGDTQNNKTGVNTVSAKLAKLGKTTAKITIALAGTGVRAIDTSIALPANVSVEADGGIVKSGVVNSLVSGSNNMLDAIVSGSSLRVNFKDGDAVIKAGDVLTVLADVDAGVAAPAATDFTLSGSTLYDINGNEVSGTLSVH